MAASTDYTPIFAYRRSSNPGDLFVELKLTGLPEDTPKPLRIKFLWLDAPVDGLGGAAEAKQLLFESWATEGQVTTRRFVGGAKLVVEKLAGAEKVVFTPSEAQQGGGEEFLMLDAGAISDAEDARIRRKLVGILQEQQKAGEQKQD